MEVQTSEAISWNPSADFTSTDDVLSDLTSRTLSDFKFPYGAYTDFDLEYCEDPVECPESLTHVGVNEFYVTFQETNSTGEGNVYLQKYNGTLQTPILVGTPTTNDGSFSGHKFTDRFDSNFSSIDGLVVLVENNGTDNFIKIVSIATDAYEITSASNRASYNCGGLGISNPLCIQDLTTHDVIPSTVQLTQRESGSADIWFVDKDDGEFYQYRLSGSNPTRLSATFGSGETQSDVSDVTIGDVMYGISSDDGLNHGFVAEEISSGEDHLYFAHYTRSWQTAQKISDSTVGTQMNPYISDPNTELNDSKDTFLAIWVSQTGGIYESRGVTTTPYAYPTPFSTPEVLINGSDCNVGDIDDNFVFESNVYDKISIVCTDGASSLKMKTTYNHGYSWGLLKEIHNTGASTMENISVSLVDHRVYITYTLAGNNNEVFFIESIDDGETFSSAVEVGDDILEGQGLGNGGLVTGLNDRRANLFYIANLDLSNNIVFSEGIPTEEPLTGDNWTFPNINATITHSYCQTNGCEPRVRDNVAIDNEKIYFLYEEQSSAISEALWVAVTGIKGTTINSPVLVADETNPDYQDHSIHVDDGTIDIFYSLEGDVEYVWYHTRSTNDGVSFSTAQQLDGINEYDHTEGMWHVDGDNLYMVNTISDADREFKMIRSENGGSSWLSPVNMTDYDDTISEEAFDPEMLYAVNGDIHMAYTGYSVVDDENAVFIVTSTDNGASWTDPLVVYSGDDVNTGDGINIFGGTDSDVITIIFTENISDDIANSIRSTDGGLTWGAKIQVWTTEFGDPASCQDSPAGISTRWTQQGDVIHSICQGDFVDDEPNEKKVFYSKTIDMGFSWTTPIEIDEFDMKYRSDQVQGLQIITNGESVYIAYDHVESRFGDAELIYSVDNGATWDRELIKTGEFPRTSNNEEDSLFSNTNLLVDDDDQNSIIAWTFDDNLPFEAPEYPMQYVTRNPVIIDSGSDADSDGIPDIDDQCINDPETFNGFEDEDGCPDVVPPGIGDIELVGFSPIQVIPIDDPNNEDESIIRDKQTLLKVDLKNTFSTFQIVEVALTYQPPGFGFPVTITEQVTLAPVGLPFSKYLPSNEFILPCTSGNICTDFMFDASVVIDPNNLIDETDESNNHDSFSILTKDTNEYGVLFGGVSFFDNRGSTNNVFVPGPTIFETRDLAEGASSYMKGMFPIAENEFTTKVQKSIISSTKVFNPSDRLEITRMLLTLDRVAEFTPNVKTVIGTVPEDWFRDNFPTDYSTTLGVAFVSPFDFYNGALVEVGDDEIVTAAHEAVHTFSWVDRLNRDSGVGAHFDRPASGYWVAEREVRHDQTDLMLPTAIPLDQAWISQLTFEHIRGIFLENPLDPPLILIGGIIFDDDTSLIESFYRMDGVFDIPLNNPGEFTLLYLDENDVVLAETGFDVVKTISGQEENDFGAFSLKVPDVVGTKKLMIERSSEVIHEHPVSVNPPQITITSPNGGEIFTHGDTIHISWQASDLDDDPLNYVILLSEDNGITWVPLSIDETETQFSFLATDDIVSDTMRVKVVVTDGINTSEDISDSPFSIQGILEQPPRLIKESSLTDLEGLLEQDIDKKTEKDLKKAIKSLQKSLDDKSWIDDSHLKSKDGKKVFSEEKKTVKELEKIVKKDKETSEFISEVSAVMLALVDADAKLATIALDDAQAFAGDKKTDKEIEKAEKEIIKAEKELGKEKFDKAIKHYEKAWKHAIKAIDDDD